MLYGDNYGRQSMSRNIFIPFLFSAASVLFAQNDASIPSQNELIHAAGTPQVNKAAEQLIEGFVIVPGGTLLDNVPREHGVHVLLKGYHEGLNKELQKYLNHPLSDQLILQVKTTIVDYFRKMRGEYVAAIMPIQEVQNSVLVFQVLEGHVGQIKYQGQKWFSERVIRNGLGVKTGDPLIESNFLNDTTFFNRNPFHKAQMVLVPSNKKGTTDLLFIIKDRFPVRFYAGSDNSGYIANGTFRLYGGFNWGDALMLGDILSYQYTASTNFHSFQSHVVNYISFLPWKDILTVYGTYGQVFPNIPNFTTSGVNVQASGRYQIPIRPFYGVFRHHFEFGFDWIYINSNFFFSGNVAETPPTTNQSMEITQFLFSYNLQRNWLQHLLSFRIDMYLSPWKNWIFPHQTTAEYNGLRPNSHVRYAYWKMSLGDVYKTKEGITLSWLLRGQVATATLPTAEQFTLGGINTVRGYYENQFLADNAFCANLEIYTPIFPVFKGVNNDLSFLAFLDYGYGYNYSADSSQFIKQNLLGIGPGIRFNINPYFIMKMDYGFQILAIPQDNRTGRFHYSVNASY